LLRRGAGATLAVRLRLAWRVGTVLGLRLRARFLAVSGIGAAAPRSVHLNVRCKLLPCEVKILSEGDTELVMPEWHF